MDNIRFGTDGWRSVIADGFTVGNVARISRGTARWLINQEKEKDASVVIGYDTRFGGKMFAETAAKIFAHSGIRVYLADPFVTTPMVSYGVIKRNASLGVVITASHNPYHYNGFKVKGPYGGPLPEQDTRTIETLIPELNEIHLESLHFDEYLERKMIIPVNLEDDYTEHVRNNFDLEMIGNSRFAFAYDAMYGAGQRVISRLLPGVHLVNCEQDYSFGGIPPEPLDKNLKRFSSFIRKNGKIDSGLAVDGDADRIAMYDAFGNYVDSHNIMLLLIHYLHKYKGYTGKVVTGFSSTSKIEKLCAYYGLEVQRVKIGFKEICSVMLNEKVLLGGEESGGIGVISHMPERDGIWMGLLIWQFMVETGKSVSDLLEEVYGMTGKFAFERSALNIGKKAKAKITEKCRNGQFSHFGKRSVRRTEDLDGYKFFLGEDEWVMIRASGTEPVLRTYAESTNRETALEILRDAEKAIMDAAAD
ncbi:MAG: phosphoglucomutase/phosphomannomutase family protein [Marinilabiliales bacterium]|nr:MAG: phosphoglucomutase/phosphomannomutase family protein [Marinilabiliales bacterium]